MNIINKKIELPDGRVIEIETGKVAKQADGSAVIRMENTMLLATVTCAKEVDENTDFLPLQVDYREKYYSAGRFPGGFLKREGRPSDYEVLISRLIDRALRPLFPEDHLIVFVNVWLISAEKDISLTRSPGSRHPPPWPPATFRSSDRFPKSGRPDQRDIQDQSEFFRNGASRPRLDCRCHGGEHHDGRG